MRKMDMRRGISNWCRSLWFLALVALTTILTLHLYTARSNVYKNVKQSLEHKIQFQGGSKHRHGPHTFAVHGEDKAFLGRRRDSRTIANATSILEGCNGHGKEGWRNTSHCIEYLRFHEDQYLTIDDDAEPCDAKHITKYHTYWRGPLTWRVSFMLKSYFYTQNLKCSEMNIWLDADHDADTIAVTLRSPILRPFLPFVDSGMIRLRAWTYPRSVHIPPEYQEEDCPDDMLKLRQYQIPRSAVAVSDSVRFVVLHQEGGLYIDMDTMFLKDMRPLLITPNLAFAERWGAHPGAGEYNTAYLRLQPNSSLSSRILQGAARMGLNFHPRVIGRMLAKTVAHKNDLVMFETGVFDPLWSFFDHDNIGHCTVPCLGDFGEFYQRRPIRHEWSQLRPEDALERPQMTSNVEFVAPNRTLANFFRGAYVHHIHNQWHKQVVPDSWVWVADQTYNQFFRGERPNPYGEHWQDKIDFSAEEIDFQP